jgi:hypothetical protein
VPPAIECNIKALHRWWEGHQGIVPSLGAISKHHSTSHWVLHQGIAPSLGAISKLCTTSHRA